MKLVTVETTFDADNLAQPMAQLVNEATTVRAMKGCVAYDLYSGIDDGQKIVIIQRWASMQTFDAYRQSETFARLGTGLRPFMTSPPVTTVCDLPTDP